MTAVNKRHENNGGIQRRNVTMGTARTCTAIHFVLFPYKTRGKRTRV